MENSNYVIYDIIFISNKTNSKYHFITTGIGEIKSDLALSIVQNELSDDSLTIFKDNSKKATQQEYWEYFERAEQKATKYCGLFKII